MTDQPNDKTNPTPATKGAVHDGRGRFTRTIDTAQRDAEAARLRARGLSYRQIAAELTVDVATAHAAVQRALNAVIEDAGEEVRKLELERLDTMYAAALEVLDRQHVTVSNGKIIRRQVGWERDDAGEIQCDGEGKPIAIYEDLLDDSPVLQAIDRLLRIQERRAKLLGLDAEKKINVSGGVAYRVLGVNVDDDLT